MKQKKIFGSRKFWMALVAILGTFILLSVVLCVFINPFQRTIDTTSSPQIAEKSIAATDDHSYEAVKERVDEVNDNYGKSIKSAYYGENSTMRQMMQQRMFFSGLKSTLIIVLIAMVILLVLIKGFNLKLFKKRILEGVPDKVDPADEKIEQKPVQTGEKAEKSPEKKDKPIVQKEEKTEETEEVDVREVTDSCQLP
jgi:hypothetical protein